LLRHFENGRESRDLGDVSQTRQLLQCRLRLGRQTDELRDHEVDHIVGVSLGVNAINVPGPARSIMIKDEHFFFGERGNELNSEEWIAARLLFHQLRERCTIAGLAAKRVPKQLLEVLLGERTKRDLLYRSPSNPDRLQLPHQGMSGIDFVVPISTDQQE